MNARDDLSGFNQRIEAIELSSRPRHLPMDAQERAQLQAIRDRCAREGPDRPMAAEAGPRKVPIAWLAGAVILTAAMLLL